MEKIGLYKKQSGGQQLSFDALCLMPQQHLLLAKEQHDFKSLIVQDSLTSCLSANQEYITLVDSIFSQNAVNNIILAFEAEISTEVVNPNLTLVLDVSDDKGYHFYD